MPDPSDLPARLLVLAEAGASCGSCRRFTPDDSGYDVPFGSCSGLPSTADRSGDTSAWMEAQGLDSYDLWPDWTDGDWMGACHPAAPAFTSDASGYASKLHVHPDRFVCPAWEPAP